MTDDIERRLTETLGRLAGPTGDRVPEFVAPTQSTRRSGQIVGGVLAVAAVLAGTVWFSARRDADVVPATEDQATAITDTASVAGGDPQIGLPTSVVIPPIEAPPVAVTPAAAVSDPAAVVPQGRAPLVEIPDASIFYLPDPMPDGWHVWEAIHGGGSGLDWEEPLGPPLRAVPPIAPGTFREFSVHLGRDDGATDARLQVVETPTFLPDRTDLPVESEFIDLGGIRRVRAVTDTTSAWTWVQDGHNVMVEFNPPHPDEATLIGAIAPASGRRVAVAVADGQLAARSLPEVASTTEEGFVQRAHGANGRTLAICVEQPSDRCYFPVGPYAGLDPERAKLIVAGASLPGIATFPADDLPNDDLVFGWVPAALVNLLAPGITVIPGGETGSFLLSRLTPTSPCAVALTMVDGGLECISTQNPNSIGLPT